MIEAYVRSPFKLLAGSLIMMTSMTSPMSRLMMCWPVLGYSSGLLPSSRNTVRGLLSFTVCMKETTLGVWYVSSPVEQIGPHHAHEGGCKGWGGGGGFSFEAHGGQGIGRGTGAVGAYGNMSMGC